MNSTLDPTVCLKGGYVDKLGRCGCYLAFFGENCHQMVFDGHNNYFHFYKIFFGFIFFATLTISAICVYLVFFPPKVPVNRSPNGHLNRKKETPLAIQFKLGLILVMLDCMIQSAIYAPFLEQYAPKNDIIAGVVQFLTIYHPANMFISHMLYLHYIIGIFETKTHRSAISAYARNNSNSEGLSKEFVRKPSVLSLSSLEASPPLTKSRVDSVSGISLDQNDRYIEDVNDGFFMKVWKNFQRWRTTKPRVYINESIAKKLCILACICVILTLAIQVADVKRTNSTDLKTAIISTAVTICYYIAMVIAIYLYATKRIERFIGDTPSAAAGSIRDKKLEKLKKINRITIVTTLIYTLYVVILVITEQHPKYQLYILFFLLRPIVTFISISLYLFAFGTSSLVQLYAKFRNIFFKNPPGSPVSPSRSTSSSSGESPHGRVNSNRNGKKTIHVNPNSTSSDTSSVPYSISISNRDGELLSLDDTTNYASKSFGSDEEEEYKQRQNLQNSKMSSPSSSDQM